MQRVNKEQGQSQKEPSRKGLTLIELLVSTSIISLLMALTLPAVMSSRSAARSVECVNNLRQLGMAEQNYEQAHGGNLPPLDDGSIPGNWVFHLLPHMDHAAVHRELEAQRTSWTPPVSGSLSSSSGPATPGGGGSLSGPSAYPQLNVPHLKVLTCPVDSFHFGNPGGLSYVANAGYIRDGKWDSGNDTSHSLEAYTLSSPTWAIDITRSTGVFFRSTTGRRIRRNENEDGSGQTIMFSENVQAGRWDSPFTGDITFGADAVFFVDIPTAVIGPLSLGGDLFLMNRSTINAEIDTAVHGKAPRPSSFHHMGVHVGFLDGSARFISESINDFIYFRLLTRNGQNYGQELVSDGTY